MTEDDGATGPDEVVESSISETARFNIGAEVVAGDGSCGELTRVIIDPVASALPGTTERSAAWSRSSLSRRMATRSA